MNKKNNHRFRETEIRMQTSMLEIMKNTELKKITVKKICEKAGEGDHGAGGGFRICPGQRHGARFGPPAGI